MMDQKRFQDAHTFLNKFCCLIRNDHDAMIWYYALCMDMMVDINFKIVSYETCYQWYSDRKASLVLSEGLSRFYANMFLWATRRKLYENAQKWMEWSLNSFNVENSFVNSFTGMRIMEALTLMLHASLTSKNVEKQFYLSGELKNIILLLENNVKAQNYFRERFELHRKHAKTILKPENYFSRK